MVSGDFLYSFGNLIAQQYNVSAASNNTLAVQAGTYPQYGQLGAFADYIDQTTERSYVEEGASFNDPYNPTPKQMNVIMQTPDINVFIKKRAFSSLAENYRPDLMDEQERLFYNATKILFANKCQQLANYEQLSKIAQVSMQVGQLSTYLLPTLFSVVDNMTTLPLSLGAAAAQSMSTFANIVDRVREIVALNQDNIYTTWVTNPQSDFNASQGPGTGVIELTSVTSLTTTTGLKFGEGEFSLTIADPYEIMLIRNYDIETALYNASNPPLNNSFTQLGINAIQTAISLDQQELNSARLERGVNSITFNVQPTIIPGGQQIFAIINNTGEQINFAGGLFGATIDPSGLEGSSLLGSEGLSPTEATIFSSIISAMYSQFALNTSSQVSNISYNQDPLINNVRKRLRLNYANKLIIQPMDVVHIYIGSRKRIDNGIIGGLQTSFGGSGFMQISDNLASDLVNTFNVNQSFSLEKEVYVGPNFPSWLWLAMRDQFVTGKNGAHVFAGVVGSATSSYAEGVRTVSVSGKDSADYFNCGIINFKPSLQVYNGPLYDPLTPFDIQFDSTTGVQTTTTPPLLSENQGMFSSVFIKNKNGPLAGTIPTETDFSMPDAERTQGNTNRRVFYDPEGLVYRWKEGIGSTTAFGDSFSPNPIDGGVSALTENPFAGQGVMNTLSLLICGQPYNFATYYKAALASGNLTQDPATGESAAPSYFKSLRASLKERNAIYGNFIPFKKLLLDDASYAQILSGQLTVGSYNDQLNTLLQQRASLADKLVYLGGSKQSTGGPANPGAQQLAQQLQALDTQINNLTNQINTSLTTLKPISIVGNDISYDSSQLNTGSSTNISTQDRIDLRQKLNFLTQRVIWKVRGNIDQNLLIIDDTYDKDSDVQGFETAFTNPSLLNSDYESPKDKIQATADLLDLEVFSNSQGHIEIRVPRYNFMPSSVFYRMFDMATQTGVKVFPQFLEDLYTTQLNGLFQNIQVNEDEIRLNCLALGYNDDPSCITFINSTSGTNTINIAGGTGQFNFLSDPSTGKIQQNLNFTVLSAMANPDQLLSTVQTELSAFTPQANASAFNIATRANIIQSNVVIPSSPNSPTQFSNLSSIQNNQTSLSRMTLITNRYLMETGTMFQFNQIFGNTNPSAATISSSDVLSVINEIAGLLSSRQIAIKAAVAALTNVQESITPSQDGTGSNATSNPSLLGSPPIPQAFQYMIEDETYDDYGPGSRFRFTIRNHDVISYNITENKPNYTAVQVNGRMGTTDYILPAGALPQDLNLNNNGNAITTAEAIDYDLWRMYGLWKPTAVDRPYLNDPEGQCAPYAVSLLNRMRASIISGTVDIVGNEYQQPGDVIYLENRDLLFYVEKVQHNFTYGEGFTTGLTITYGHNAGEYIPTTYDVIGKVLYRTKDITTYTHKRQGTVFNQEHIGSIVGNINNQNLQSTSSISDDITNGPYGEANRATLQNIIASAATSLAAAANNFTPTLEVRIYYDSAVGTYGSPASYATQLQAGVLSALNGSALSGNVAPTANTNSNNQSLAAFSSQIKTVNVDSNPNIVGEFRYPSAKAYFYARDAVSKTSSNTSGTLLQQNVDNMIYNYIVDCWIVFNNPTNTSSTPTSGPSS